MFDNRHWPVDKDGLASFGNEEINELFQHHKEFFIDTNREAVFEHWLGRSRSIRAQVSARARLQVAMSADLGEIHT